MKNINYNQLANISASLLGLFAVFYVLTLGQAFPGDSYSGIPVLGFYFTTHTFAVLGMIFFFNTAIFLRAYHWYLHPKREKNAWTLLLIADGLAAVLLAAAIYYFVSTGIIEFIWGGDSRIAVLAMLYLLTQILQIVARSMLKSAVRRSI